MQKGLHLFRVAAAFLEKPELQKALPRLLASVWGWLGRIHFNLVLGAEGETYHHRQLELAKAINDPLNEAFALAGLARFATDQSNWSEVIAKAEAALEIFTRLNHPQGLILTMTLLGIANQHPDEMRKWYLQAVEVGRGAGDVRAYLLPLVNLGYLATDIGQYAEAKAYFQEAETLFEQTGPVQSGRLYYLWGRLAAFMGEYDEAFNFFEQSRAIRLQEGSVYGVAQAERWLGRIYQLRGDMDTARQILQRSLQSFVEKEHASSIQIALSHLGLTEEAAGNLALARKHFSEALELARELNRTADIVFNQANLVWVLVGAGELDAAQAELHQAYTVLDPHADPRGALNLLTATTAFWIASGQTERVLPVLSFVLDHPITTAETKGRARKMLEKMPSPPEAIEKAQEEMGDLEQIVAYSRNFI